MKKIVISQPMFFPWIGLFEQIKLADIYVHYDDVQFSKGSFTNRVQIKTKNGFKWLTIPLKDIKLGQIIRDVKVCHKNNWREQHIKFLSQNYFKAPYQQDMLDLVNKVYSQHTDMLVDLTIASLNEVCRYFNLKQPDHFLYSSNLNIGGKSSQRVVNIVKYLQGNIYITGHGASNYLDHQLFEREGIRVEYMNYQKISYPQLYGEFTPYVSILDLIANVGRKGTKYIDSSTTYWRDFIK
ncbi:WbqC family protein [Geminocystis sp. GBBB08]|uniref:WbqC family protein n=1 Tax=Geminocystis sp. GBBB08 TaxID=2604140 RepID=UPI0027E282F0|nr:WbqC family protein [Geminocystis sp. GBBB08]MBL1210714.1 WbqC family protein [Geminocystis sp. GBBB08]